MADDFVIDIPAEDAGADDDWPPDPEHRVGDVIKLAPGARVTFPGGRNLELAGSFLVLDQPGTFIVDGTTYEVVEK